MQTDIRMPKRHLQVLEDVAFNGPFQRAIEAAIKVGPCTRPCCISLLAAASSLQSQCKRCQRSRTLCRQSGKKRNAAAL
jgi:hypothetical protein